MITIKFAAHDDLCALGYMVEWRKRLEGFEDEVHFEVSYLSRADVRHWSECGNKVPTPKRVLGLENIVSSDPSSFI